MKHPGNPQTFPERNAMNLRVRFYPLWGWFFVTTVLLAQTYLATRLWGGWNALALLQLVAFQLIFLPRIVLIAAGISLGLTILSSRLVRWIAHPLAIKWFTPLSLIPPESEITLYLRTGERAIAQIPGRRRTERTWEPGWLILTNSRLVWLSGIWRTICWEIDFRDPARPLLSCVGLGRTPRWFGGYVVGVPPRLIALHDHSPNENPTRDVLAIADPAGFLQMIGSIPPGGVVPDRSITTFTEADTFSVDDSNAMTKQAPAERSTPAKIELPPPRDYSRTRRRKGTSAERREESKNDTEPTQVPTPEPDRQVRSVRGIVLPPRRNYHG